jgi:drug/metabolite transporter (DMT)-like permease
MIASPYLWAVFTLIAAAAQTARNAMQRELTATLGTVGATHVRFLFGFPFGLLFAAGVFLVTGASPPPFNLSYALWIALGAAAQTLAMVLMLAAMNDRSFVVVYAYIKTEPVQVALFGLLLLGDRITLPTALAILIATVGVVVMSLRPGVKSSGRTALLGLAAGGLFGLSAIGFRGAILNLGLPDYIVAATYTSAIGLCVQAVPLSIYLGLRNPGVLRAIFRAWRPSLFAGFTGAFASQFWFLAFALASAASVRTLALVEVLFAQGISRFAFKQPTTPREAAGIVLIVIGVVLLIWVS